MANPPEDIELKNLNLSYSSLGRYVASFEQIVHHMRVWVMMTLQVGGLQKQELASAVVHSDAMTAQPLLQLIQSMMTDMEFYSEEKDPGSKKILDKLYSKIQDAIIERNKIVHGTWFIPQHNEVIKNPEGLFGFKGKTGKMGATRVSSLHTLYTLAARSDELDRLAQMAMRAAMTCATHLYEEDHRRFTEMFWWEGDELREGRPPKPAAKADGTPGKAD